MSLMLFFPMVQKEKGDLITLKEETFADGNFRGPDQVRNFSFQRHKFSRMISFENFCGHEYSQLASFEKFRK